MRCELIVKRKLWVNYLSQGRDTTKTVTYSNEDLENILNLQYSQSQLHKCIAKTIMKPNKTWLALKITKYITPKTYFRTYA